ncbi:MAG: hypothetical protein ACRDSR_01805 [Pseudonocardiaceae bacterium]
MAYDIADPKRLRRICTLMEDYGERLQYSVFLCDLTVAERAELESAVTEVMTFMTTASSRSTSGHSTRPPQYAPSDAPAACRPPARRSCDRCERSGTTTTRGHRSHAGQRPFFRPSRGWLTACRGGLQPPLARAAILPGHGHVFGRALSPAPVAGLH